MEIRHVRAFRLEEAVTSTQPPRWFPGWQQLLLLAVVMVAARLVLLWPVGLNDDEAYYWAWSHMPSLSYFDNSPGAGWFLMPFTVLFGDHIMTLRLLTALVGILIAFAITDAVSRLFPELQRGDLLRVLWLSSLSGVVILPSMVWTPDALLLLFTTLALCQLFTAVEDSKAQAWVLAGLFFGLAILAKANAALYVAIVGIWALFYSPARRQLLTPWPWLGFTLVLLALLPILLWNARNDWAFFRFQGGHIFAPEGAPKAGETAHTLELSFSEPLLLIVACLIFIGPATITAVQLMWRLLRRGGLSPSWHLILTVVISTMLFFVAISIYKGFAANWAILSILVIFIVGIGELVRRSKRWIVAQALMAVPYVALFVALSYLPATVGVSYNWRDGLVWEETYQIMREQQAKLGGDVILAAIRYQDAAQLAFQERHRWQELPGEHLVPALHLSGRSSHFAFMYPEQSYRGQDMLIISEKSPATPRKYFCEFETIGVFQVSHLGQEIREFNLYHGIGFFGRPDVVGHNADCPN